MKKRLDVIQVVPDVISVFAGLDRSICNNQDLTLTDLNATITGDVSDGDWLTFGDGRFQPGNLLTVRYSLAVNNGLTYVPGPNDKALGFFRLMLISDAPTGGNPQQKVNDEVIVTFQSPPPLFCSNNINISLDESCSQVVDATMLQPNPMLPYSNYIITLFHPNGTIITDNTLTKEHVDLEIAFKLGHMCTSNICWGKFKVEDYFPPVFVCKNDTISCTQSFLPASLGFPFPQHAFIDTIINNKFVVKDWDACSDVLLEYTDTSVKAECTRDEDKTISRKWKATDAKGNISYCTEKIVVKRLSLPQVVFPKNFDGHDLPAFECGETFPMLANGYPSPDTTGIPTIGHCGNLQYSYTDVPFALCGQSYKIARGWFVIDWCTSESITKNQIIHIKDSKSPSFVCQDSILLEAGPYACRTDRLPVPLLTDVKDCSTYDVTYQLYDDQGSLVNQFLANDNGSTHFENLPFGQYTLKYTITDACQNVSNCTSQVIVADHSPPYPACDSNTKVSLDAAGKGRIFASSFDDGSTDNCGIATFKARKMTDRCGFGLSAGNYIDFCCAELGETVMVAMEVTDIHGNVNTCMVEVVVEDKLKPTITCPPNITLACTDNYDFKNLDIYGTVVTDPLKVKNIVIQNYYHNGIVGKDGLASDNCNVTVTQSYRHDIKCHTGYIYRTFIATDAQGSKDSCVQTITVLNPDPVVAEDIIWPDHYYGDGCRSEQTSPDVTGKPTFTHSACANVTSSYDDIEFYIADSACVKILRTWTAVDWCQFDGANSKGKWGPYTQIIKLHNLDKPVITSSCQNTSFCSYDVDCKVGYVNLKASAEDPCTYADDLVWSYSVDLMNNGTIDSIGKINEFSGYLPLGQHKISWLVSDQCGNNATCSYEFSVIDCKYPTPYCLSSLTIPLDQVDGSAEVWAYDFDKGSYDNCTNVSDLRYTFNGALPVVGMQNQLHYFIGKGSLSNESEYKSGRAQVWKPDTRSSGLYFDCDDIADGISDTILLSMTITDIDGNQDFCQTELILQDNANHCPDMITTGQITGSIKTSYDLVPVGIKVKYMTDEIESSVSTDSSTGTYEIDRLPFGKEYTLMPELNSDPLQGVTTLDLVMIQRHILGVTPFSNPYLLIASDANSSKSVSAADLVEIRKLILGISDKFPKNLPSWVFVPKKNGIPNQANPLNYLNAEVIRDFDGNRDSVDFVAVKIGDVNLSAVELKSGHLSSRKLMNQSPFHLMPTIENIDGKFQLVFRSGEDVFIDGLQLFCAIDLAHKIIDVNNNLNSDQIEYSHHVHDSGFNYLNYSADAQFISKGDAIFSVILDDVLDLSTLNLLDTRHSEIYLNGIARPIKLVHQYQKSSDMANMVTLVTNPVSDVLNLKVNTQLDHDRMEFSILNLTGKDCKSGGLNFTNEQNEFNIVLPQDLLPGIYFLQLKSGNYHQTLKFIRIK